MGKVAIIVGAAGVGKTTRLLDTMAKVLDTGVADPYLIGFVSFTRAARAEAAARAADRFGLNPESLERDGWFRTLHAVCFRQLAVGAELLTPCKATREWLAQAVQDEVSGTGEPNDDGIYDMQERKPADIAVHLWSVARNRLVALAEVHERASRCDERTPDLEYCRHIVEAYERSKRLDHRCDFTDLLGRFAGWSFFPGEHLEVSPQGAVPDVPVWFIDEAQDNSPLTDAVARRLTENARWTYLVGDPWQSIFGFAGADPALFQKWDGVRHLLTKSWRCPSAIVALGEDCIRGCSDYWNRNVESRGPGGTIEAIDYCAPWPDEIDPRDSWLLLARTNFVARRLQQRLNAAGVPWLPTKGNGGWNAPEQMKALTGLLTLSRGGGCAADEWGAILKHVPSKANGTELFTRGTKTRWEEREKTDELEFRSADGCTEWGATEHFAAAVRSGRWVEWIDRACDFCVAQERWGWAGVQKPNVRIGTIHSAKGLEADNVLIFPTTSHQVCRSAQDVQGADEEARLSYVAVTRARERVIIAREHARYEMDIPA